jgi:hypothetical protein
MTVFAVIAPTLDVRLERAVSTRFSNGRYYKITPQQFLVDGGEFTTQQVADALSVPGGNVGTVMVLRVTNYTGWHSKDMWEWLEIHSARGADA